MTEVELSTVIRNYVITLGVGLGGLWAFWKWSFSEWLRQNKDMPSVDGELSTSEVILKEGEIVLSLSALWRNRSDHPVFIDEKSTRVDVYAIDKDKELGPFVAKSDLGDPIYKTHPYKDMDGFILEPNTESLLKTHYVLKQGEVYLFRWKLYRSRKKHKNVLYAWTKELVYEAISPNKSN